MGFYARFCEQMSRRQIYLKRISKVSSLPVLDRVSSKIKFILARLKFCLELDSNFQGKRIVSTLIILPTLKIKCIKKETEIVVAK